MKHDRAIIAALAIAIASVQQATIWSRDATIQDLRHEVHLALLGEREATCLVIFTARLGGAAVEFLAGGLPAEQYLEQTAAARKYRDEGCPSGRPA